MEFEIRASQVMNLNLVVDTNGGISPAFLLQWIMFRKYSWFDIDPILAWVEILVFLKHNDPCWKEVQPPTMHNIHLKHPHNGHATLNGLMRKFDVEGCFLVYGPMSVSVPQPPVGSPLGGDQPPTKMLSIDPNKE